MGSETRECEWCHRPFTVDQVSRALYCRRSCRQRKYEARQRDQKMWGTWQAAMRYRDRKEARAAEAAAGVEAEAGTGDRPSRDSEVRLSRDSQPPGEQPGLW